MSCRSAANIKIEPMKVWFAQVPTFCVDVEAVGATNLDNKSWKFDVPSGKFQVWYNVDAAGVAPTPVVGYTLVEVAVNTGDSAATVAAAVIVELNLLTDVIALADPKNAGKVIVKGLGYEAAAAAPAAVTVTGHVFEVVSAGFFHDFGYTDGDLELSTEQQTQDISAHQSGVEPITSIITGLTAEVAVALKEISPENLERLIELTSGGAFTPVGGTKIMGFGSGQNFSNVLDRAGRLILHPVRLVDTDNTEDWCLWLAYPKLGGLVFSGENPELINVTFMAYRDEFINSFADKLAYGDHTQQ